MTTFSQDESSIESNRPLEGFRIDLPTATYYLTSGEIDQPLTIPQFVPLIGFVNVPVTFTATTIDRGPMVLSNQQGQRELIIYLPVSHAVCQRFLQQGIPPKQVLVTLYRKQLVSGVTMQAWKGYATSLAVDKHQATMRVPSLTEDAMKVKLPTVVASRTCTHALYDTFCTVSRANFTRTLTVLSVSGNVLVVDSSAITALAAGWGTYGEIVHENTGERRSVLLHEKSTPQANQDRLTLLGSIPELGPGDLIDLSAGCDHTAAGASGCALKFGNTVNFGGLPLLPTDQGNPFDPTGKGVIRS